MKPLVATSAGIVRTMPSRPVGCALILIVSFAASVSVRAEETVEPPSLEPPVASEAFHLPDAQLAELVTALLEENPGIQVGRATWRARLERVPQRAALPDPMLGYRWFAETPETRVGPQEHGLELTQAFPGKGKRAERARQAELEASSHAFRVRELERSLVASLKREYYEAAYLQEALTLNTEETALLRRFERTTLTRYSTGEGSQQDVIKVQTDISRLADRDTLLREQLEVVRRRIARLIGRPDAEVRLRPIELELAAVDLERDALEEEASRLHPGVRAGEEGIEAGRAWVRRRQLESRPDFRLGVSWTLVGDRDDPAAAVAPPEDDGQDVWALSVGLTLPVQRKRIRAGIAEAEESLRGGRLALDETRHRLREIVQESVVRLESTEYRARLYREVILPQAEQSLDSAEAAYSTNRQDFLDVLDAQRVLFQARLTLHRLLADYWVAMVDLEYGLGRAFPEGGSLR